MDATASNAKTMNVADGGNIGLTVIVDEINGGGGTKGK
jgi:hypothetical protein